MNAEPDHLASAYLDGELTDEERRIAEADPAVMAEVEQLRALRAELATPPPPSDAVREAAIAAAMAEFGRTHGVGAATAPARANDPSGGARVVPYRPRPAWSGWLSAAAAVLVIGVLGIAVVAGVRGGDDDDSAADEPAMDAAAEEPADDGARMTEAAPTVAADGDAAADEPAMEMAEADEEAADVMVDDAGAEEPAAEEPAEEPAAEEPAAEEPAADEPASTFDVPVGDPLEYLDQGRPIVVDEELTAVGAYLAEQVADGTIGATPEHSCPFPNVLDTAEVLDPRTGEVTPVYLDVAPDVNLVLAVDRESCDVLLDAPLDPEP